MQSQSSQWNYVLASGKFACRARNHLARIQHCKEQVVAVETHRNDNEMLVHHIDLPFSGPRKHRFWSVFGVTKGEHEICGKHKCVFGWCDGCLPDPWRLESETRAP